MAKDDATRRKIAAAIGEHVAFDGWTDRALQAALTDLGLPADAGWRAFPKGMGEIVAFHLAEADRRLAASLAKTDLSGLRVRERVALGVRLSLEGGKREAVRRTLLYLALPGHGAIAAKALARSVDTIWRAAGDTATDFNYYTKRGLLAGVVMATTLYWLGDDSPGGEASWRFLDRRIADALRLGTLPTRVSESVRRFAPPFSAVNVVKRWAARF
jgi:ubiquinone biosynthesis protein COQ9